MTSTITRSIVLAGLFVASTSGAWAQTPAAPAAPSAPPPNLPSPPPNYVYSPDGRRDPFVNLINRGAEPRSGAAKRADGPAGIPVAELMVRGIVQSRGTWTAMVAGADGKVFVVKAGDRLADGTVRAVTAQAVVILQEVNDPLSLEKRREVRKYLRGGEEVK